jgi:5-hydroxyisourate hydrolase-like protein (transthyretin family)
MFHNLNGWVHELKRFDFSISDLCKLLVFLTLTIGLLSSIPFHAGAQPATEIRVVNPETGDTNFLFYTNTTFKDDRFNVTLRIYNVANLDSFQVFLTYDPTLLNATPTRAWLPTANTDYIFYGKSTVSPPPSFYYSHSRWGYSVGVADTLLFGETPVDGNGLLAIVEFKIISEPAESEVVSANFSYHQDTILYDSNLEEIPSTKTNGYYQYTWAQPLFLLNTKPSLYEATALGTFNITIWLNNTVFDQELVNVSFRLSYDATLLNATQVLEGSFLKGVGTTTFDYIFGLGNITVTNALDSPYTSFPEGDGEITIITFESIYQDAEDHLSYLRFKDIQLLNSTIGSIAGSKKDGIYTISFAGSQISINADKTVVTLGSNITFSGSISPPQNDVEVTIQRAIVGSGNWGNISKIRTDEDGNYVYVWTANQIATWDFRAIWDGDEFIRGAESVRKNVQVERRGSTLTLNLSPNPVVLGNNVTIRGTLTTIPFETKIPNANVTIKYRRNGETNWTTLDSVLTDSQGSYSLAWNASEIAIFYIMASWPGDANTLSSDSSIIKLEVVESLPVDYLPFIVAGIVVVIVIVALVVYFKKRKP